jgi:hypothetical protein
MLYYGAKCTRVNLLLNEITGRDDHYIYDYKTDDYSVKEILHGNLSSTMIADFLNDIKVYRRDRPWTAQSILNLLKMKSE